MISRMLSLLAVVGLVAPAVPTNKPPDPKDTQSVTPLATTLFPQSDGRPWPPTPTPIPPA